MEGSNNPAEETDVKVYSPEADIPKCDPAQANEKPKHHTISDPAVEEAQKLYILGAKLGNFRVIGPWHNVNPKYIDEQADRLASPRLRPCSRGHSLGAWASEDRYYRDYERPLTSYEKLRDSRNSAGKRSVRSGYSLPLMRDRKKPDPRTSMSAQSSYRKKSSEGPKTQEEFEKFLVRITKPTTASQGGQNIAEKFENKEYVYGSAKPTPEQLNKIITRITRQTVASTGGKGIERKYTDFVIGGRTVNQSELEKVNERLTKPTVASEGGAPIANKNFEYNILPTTKTNPRIPNVTKKRNRRMMNKVSNDEIQVIVERLAKLTPAYKAKFSINPHVWVDSSKRGPAFYKQQLAMS